MSKLQIDTLDGSFWVSHEVIAQSWVQYLEKHPEDGELTGPLKHVEALFKSDLLMMASLPSHSANIRRRDMKAYANKDSFYNLVQLYNWPEGYFTPMLAALGEWGHDVALKVQREMAEGEVTKITADTTIRISHATGRALNHSGVAA